MHAANNIILAMSIISLLLLSYTFEKVPFVVDQQKLMVHYMVIPIIKFNNRGPGSDHGL